MKNTTKREKLIWATLVLAPLVTGFFILALLPAGVSQIPIHWDFSGNVNGYGSPAALLGLGGIMAATNLLMAFCYFHNDQMYDAGLVHGVSRSGSLKVLLGTGVFLVILTAIIYCAILNAI